MTSKFDLSADIKIVDELLTRIPALIVSTREFRWDLVDKYNPTQGKHCPLVSHVHGVISELENIHRILTRIKSDLLNVEVAGNSFVEEVSTLALDADERRPASVVTVKYIESRNLLKLDAATLLIFAGILLDQWCLALTYLIGIEGPSKYTFNKLIGFFAKNGAPEPASLIWSQSKGHLLWLKAQVTLVRTTIIVHQASEIQKGYMSGPGSGFTLASFGSKSISASDRHFLEGLVSKYSSISQREPESTAILGVAVDVIGTLEFADVQKVIALAKGHGGYSVSLSVFSSRLVEMIEQTLPHFVAISQEHPELVNLA